MIDIQQNSAGTSCRLVLRPNRSMSWRTTCYFLYSLIGVSGTIAVGMSLLGFWPILPFAGLELAAVAMGLYTVSRRCQRCEVISVTDDTILIERGHSGPEQSWTLAKIWAKIVLERCPREWYPSRLLIRSHGQVVEIGGFLNEDERRRLAGELVSILASSGSLCRLPPGQAE